jgi:hypothetical protein
MNDINTVGKEMKVFSKRQLLALEINALCVLTNDRAINKAEQREIADTNIRHLNAIPFMIRMEHSNCNCFTKHRWN